MADKTTYHHGDLRIALVRSALSLVEEEGVEALSLRGVARRAGVSRSAPYHHFENKEAMVAAVAEHGFDQLVESMQAVQCDDSREGLRACGHAYLTFAIEQPTLYRLMFSSKTGQMDQHPSLKARASCSFGMLVDQLARWGGGPEAGGRENLLARAMAVWGAVHGMASLLIDEKGPDEARSVDRELVVATMMAMIEGGLSGLVDSAV